MTENEIDERFDVIAIPWVVKIEFTRGCNLRCDFCPTYALPEYSADKKFLDPRVCVAICSGVRSVTRSPRVELTMRGEPTLNPDAVLNVQTIRRLLPRAQISMFTNGVEIMKNPRLAPDLLKAGVNILNIDCYKNTYERFRKIAMAMLASNTSLGVADFRTFSAYKKHPAGHRMSVVNLVPDIAGEDTTSTRKIHSNANNMDPSMHEKYGITIPAEPLEKRCMRPFREMVFTWDGKMVICCHDWQEKRVLGDVRKETAEQIWYGDEHLAVLRRLYNKDRAFAPCNKCDYHGGYRHGLVKNPFPA